MRILVVAATTRELPALVSPKLDTLVTGIGACNTAYILTRQLLSRPYDRIINVGICGSFRPEFPVGTLVEITEDVFADLGATDADGRFIDLEELGFPLFQTDHTVYNHLVNPYRMPAMTKTLPLESAKGITVNTTTGDSRKIVSLVNRFDPDVETMEGAAVAMVCARERIPYVTIRAVSNMVEPRNKSRWDIDLALHHLESAMPIIVDHIV